MGLRILAAIETLADAEPSPPDGGAPADGSDEEAFGEEQVPDSPRERILELLVTTLLALSALLSAWCAYEASRFGGDQASLDTEAARLQVESIRADARANQLTAIDVATFSSWVEATADRNSALADFYAGRIRTEARPAFDAWLATKPLTNAAAPKTPFEMPQYQLAERQRSNELLEQSQQATTDGESAGTTSDQYVLAVVLLAAALFLLGIQSRVGVFELRASLVGVATFLTLGTTVWVLVMPKDWPG